MKLTRLILLFCIIAASSCTTNGKSAAIKRASKSPETVLMLPDSAKKEITVLWDANTETDLAGYRVYFGLSPRPADCDSIGCFQYGALYDVEMDTFRVFRKFFDRWPNQTGYFAVTAYDMNGNESNYSNEVPFYFEVATLKAPIAPGLWLYDGTTAIDTAKVTLDTGGELTTFETMIVQSHEWSDFTPMNWDTVGAGYEFEWKYEDGEWALLNRWEFQDNKEIAFQVERGVYALRVKSFTKTGEMSLPSPTSWFVVDIPEGALQTIQMLMFAPTK